MPEKHRQALTEYYAGKERPEIIAQKFNLTVAQFCRIRKEARTQFEALRSAMQGDSQAREEHNWNGAIEKADLLTTLK
jgi:hypothetical protein